MIEHLIRSATCRVSCDTESGTGWLIANDRVITARHCLLPNIDNGNTIELFFHNTSEASIAGKITAQSVELDVCLLSVDVSGAAEPLPVSLDLPREGEIWQTFGYPSGKATIGHRLEGKVAQILRSPIRGVDIDLSVSPLVNLQDYRGMSGGAVVCGDGVVGLIRLQLNGTIAALSMHEMEGFLAENGIILPGASTEQSRPLLADRGDFSENFAEMLSTQSGSYFFLEGAHGYGKSTFCRNFQPDANKLVNLGTYCLSDPNSTLGASYRTQPQVFLDWLIVKVSGLITGQAPRKEETRYPDQILKVSESLIDFSQYCAKNGQQGLLFIDGLNEVNEPSMLERLLGLLPTKLPPHVSVVLTAPNFNNIEAALSGRVKKGDIVKLPPLPESSCYQYCQLALKTERRIPALIRRICEKANGHPLYLRYIVEYANFQSEDNELDDFPVMTGPIEEYYQEIWAKLLPEGNVVYMLALMARLRWGVLLTDFSKVLSPDESVQFVSVISRIRHLLADERSTTIYHESFASFIIEKTAGINGAVYHRLAQFCCRERAMPYCVLNLIHHLLLAADNSVFAECNQGWVDAVVTLGVEPDVLISDVDKVVNRAATTASADEFFRLQLLAQRLSFRYDTLFEQSARLIAEALIVLGHPNEALQHVLRHNNIIVGFEEALKTAFLFHDHEYDDEALVLLNRIHDGLMDICNSPMRLSDFLKLCEWHIQTIFLIRLAGGADGMKQIMSVMNMARDACEEALGNDPEQKDQCLSSIHACFATYFLTFKDIYTDIESLRKLQIDESMGSSKLPSYYLLMLCVVLLNIEHSVDNYHLSKWRTALPRVFNDIEGLIPVFGLDCKLAVVVTDILIRFSAPTHVVEVLATKCGKQSPRPLRIKAKNGVDVDHDYLQECLCDWRIAAFLDPAFRGTSSGIIVGSGWVESMEHLIGALYCCDGRARRAKADADEDSLIACFKQLNVQVIEPLRYTLQQRVSWNNCYAIPENVLPRVYRQLSELLIDCFPEKLLGWLDDLVASADGQWGMYSEGFRNSAFQVLEQLTREEPSDELAPRLLRLLHALRDHVLRGVENRHELVPEILRMIPIFTFLGAKEDALRMYQRLLSVSMGPTWYKEDQLGLMTEVLGIIPVNSAVALRLSKIAGFLEKASGEMTFQRYVRAEKSYLLGQIVRHGKYHAALAYFRRQCCGSASELWDEAQQGPIDKIGPLRGSRFPGGALDDQEAILELVKNAQTVSWPLRWALLEIFQCGDSRHLGDYAKAFAKIVNEVGALSELVRLTGLVINAETASKDRDSFVLAFRGALKPELHEAFKTVLASLQPVKNSDPPEHLTDSKAADDDIDNRLYHPGLIGRQNALRDADGIFEEAQKQWALGNRCAAKAQAVKGLRAAQEGGWGIWDDLSNGSRQATEMLVRDEESAANVIRHYAPLIEAERYVPKWIPARTLIGIVGPLLSQAEDQQLLDVVIDHCRLMVGDASREIQAFSFLDDDTHGPSPDIEFFRFIVWLCDHPQWLRRDRAAAKLLWVVEQVPELFSEAVTTAFSMAEGYGPDVLCGVLDGASARNPKELWTNVTSVLDLIKVTHELRHVSRLVVLERLATRADGEGSPTARSALAMLQASFIGKRIFGGNPEFPNWAMQLAHEWRQIVDLLSPDSICAWQSELERSCSPLSVTDVLALETEVASTFREGPNSPFSRWESKLRYTLNVALLPFVSREGAHMVEASLRPYNPSQPERTMEGMLNPITDQLLTAISSGDYSNVLGQSTMVLLNYHDMAVKPGEDGVSHIEVLCLLQPVSNRKGVFGSQLDQSFISSELPVLSTVKIPFETCCRLEPDDVFFDPFTPAIPIPFFRDVIGAKENDFIRRSWRYGRRNEYRGFGMPERAGCSLSVPRKLIRLPAGFKLAWIVWLDSNVVTVVDERNNQLL